MNRRGAAVAARTAKASAAITRRINTASMSAGDELRKSLRPIAPERRREARTARATTSPAQRARPDIASVASFFVSRVDTEVDRRLDEIGTDAARALRGKAAVAQAQVAYQRFRDTFTGARWEARAARGARPQRPLWASTSTKDPDAPVIIEATGLAKSFWLRSA